jgi:hypothetical protein
MCCLILGTGLAPAVARPAEEAVEKLQGTWTTTKAERDGKAGDDVVGHRLSFTGNRFQIRSEDGKLLYGGPSAWTRIRSRRPLTSSTRKVP